MRTIEEIIYDVEAERLANVFEAAVDRLGQLGREGGEAVRAKLLASDSVEVEEGLAQLEELFEVAD